MLFSDRAIVFHMCIPYGKTGKTFPLLSLSSVKVKYQSHSLKQTEKNAVVTGHYCLNKRLLFLAHQSAKC